MRVHGATRATSRLSLLASALCLAGCWTAPALPPLQPKGEARLIQGAIAVTAVRDAAVVSSLDRSAGTIVLRAPGEAETSTYRIERNLSSLGDIKAGDLVRASVAQDLSVYTLGNSQPAGGVGLVANARVLAIDPSYRLLTLKYPDGTNETFKVPLGTRLQQMQAGDLVVIEPRTLLALRRKG